MANNTNSNKTDVKTVLNNLLVGDFFSDWKTIPEVIKKLSSKGFTIKGKKVGMVSRLLTQMCQNIDNHLEREETPKERRVGQERWMFKKEK